MNEPAAKDPEARPQSRPRVGAGQAGAAPEHRRRRLNVRAALVMGAVAALAIPAYLIVGRVQDTRRGSALRKQAQAYVEAKPPRPDLAVKYLDRYLELNGGDLDAMELRARLLSETARTADDVEAATQANDLVQRLDREGPRRQEARRRLAELYLRMERYRPPSAVKYRTAEATARDLIAYDRKAGRPDARDHRLLGRALLGEEMMAETKALPQALAELEVAARLDPGDVPGAEQLAYLYADRRKDRARADAVLDALVKANPKVEARLARYRHYARFGPSEKARAELERAVREAPENLVVRLTAAEDALERNELAASRAHLATIAETARDDRRVRYLQGLLELRERHADKAIDSWRQGLRLTAGTDFELSFRLAWVLLQLGRVADAKPLMDQVRRLTGGTRPSPEYRFLEALRDARENEPARALATLEEVKPAISRTLRGAVCMTMGQCYEATRDEPRALAAYRDAAAAQPRAAEAYLNAARLLAAMRGPDAAADELRHALQQAPDDPGLLMGLARYLLQRRDWIGMRQVLDRAERVAPGSPTLVMMRADYEAATGKLDDAVKLLGHAAEHLDRRDVSLWLAYANGLLRQGRGEEALKALTRAAAADAAGDRAALRVARARLEQQLGRGRLARQELARDVESLPPTERPAVLRARVDLLNLQGDRAGALETLRRWSATTPDDPQPALIMLDMALSGNDEVVAGDAIKALTAVRQGDGAYEFIGRAYEALRGIRSPAERPARLGEADRLVRKIQQLAPDLPQGPLMQGLLREEQAKDEVLKAADRDRLLDQAIVAYFKALDNGGRAAIPRLVELLTRRHRPAELAALRKRVASDRAFDRLEIEATLKFDLFDQAEKIANQIVEADPEGLDARVLQANVLKRLGRPDDAEEALRDLAKARPGEPGPWLQLLLFQAARGRHEQAEGTIEQVRRNVKGERPEFLFAQCYRIAGDLKKAGDLYQEALKKWPDDPQVARGAADFFETTGRLDEAEAILKHILDKDPTLSWAARKLALILSSKPKDAIAWEEAAKLVAPGGSAIGDDPEDRLVRSVVLSRSPDPKVSAGAIPLLRTLKDDMPRNHPIAVAARERLIRYFLEAERPAEAWKLATDALVEGEEPAPDAIALYAEVLLRNKKPEEAEAQIARLEKLEPESLRPELLRARLLAARDQLEEADARLEASFRTREHKPDAIAVAGYVLATMLDLGRLEAAERIARREVELRPGNAWMLARVLARRERTKDALDACLQSIKAGGSRAAVQIALSLAIQPGATPQTLAGADAVLGEALAREPKSPELLLQRAQLRHLQRKFDEEVKIYRTIQESRPPSFGFLNNWAWTLSESLNRPEDGLRRISEAIKRAGRYPAYLDTQGVILVRLGRLDEAIPILEEAAPGLPGGLGYFHLARAQYKAGRDADARKALTLARDAGLKPETMEDADRHELEALSAALDPRGTSPTPRTPTPRTGP